MKHADLFRRYESLVNGADRAFQKMAKDYGQEVRCKQGCSDCCHALFGLFLIEAVFLKASFDALGRKERRKILARCDKADKELQKMQERYRPSGREGGNGFDVLGKERLRCPLLSDREVCLLYSQRPITCRVYGIPTAVRGEARVCRKAGFKEGTSYPAFNLDRVQNDLYHLSRELLEMHGRADPEQASLLISVSKALKTPAEDIIAKGFVSTGLAGRHGFPDLSE